MALLMLLKGCRVIISPLLFVLSFFFFLGGDVATVYFPLRGLYANATSAKDDFPSIEQHVRTTISINHGRGRGREWREVGGHKPVAGPCSRQGGEFVQHIDAHNNMHSPPSRVSSQRMMQTLFKAMVGDIKASSASQGVCRKIYCNFKNLHRC